MERKAQAYLSAVKEHLAIFPGVRELVLVSACDSECGEEQLIHQSLDGGGVEEIEGLLAAVDIAPTSRAEELTVAQFAALARAFRARREPS